MKTEFLYGNKIILKIQDITTNNNLLDRDLYVAVAYWGNGALEKTKLLERIKLDNKKIKIICDLRSEACNPLPVKQLIAHQVEIKMLNHMHAKVWLCGDYVIIGSANVSSNGMGYDIEKKNDMNEEAAISIHDKEVAGKVRIWFKELWKRSERIENYHIELYEKKWKNRKKSTRVETNGTFISELRLSKSKTKFNKVRIIAWEASKDGQSKQVQKITSKTGEAIYHYSEDEMEHDDRRDIYDCSNKCMQFQKGDYFLDFTRDFNQKKFHFTGLWRAVSTSYLSTDNDRHVILLYEEFDYKGVALTSSDIEILYSKINEIIPRREERTSNCAGNVIEQNVYDFVQKYIV